MVVVVVDNGDVDVFEDSVFVAEKLFACQAASGGKASHCHAHGGKQDGNKAFHSCRF